MVATARTAAAALIVFAKWRQCWDRDWSKIDIFWLLTYESTDEHGWSNGLCTRIATAPRWRRTDEIAPPPRTASRSLQPFCRNQLLLLLLKSVEFSSSTDFLTCTATECCRSCHGTACDFGVRNRRHRLCCTEDVVDLSSALWKLYDGLYVVLQR